MRRQRNLLGPQGMGGMVALWGASALVRSVQRIDLNVGSVGTSATATIVAVNTANAMLFKLSAYINNSAGSQIAYGHTRVELTNSTTVTGYVNTVSGTDVFHRMIVIEFAPGVVKSMQRGTITVASAASSGTVAITEVSTAKTLLNYNGFSTNNGTAYDITGNGDIKHWSGYIELQTGILASFARPGSVGTLTINFEAAEFF